MKMNHDEVFPSDSIRATQLPASNASPTSGASVAEDGTHSTGSVNAFQIDLSAQKQYKLPL